MTFWTPDAWVAVIVAAFTALNLAGIWLIRVYVTGKTAGIDANRLIKAEERIEQLSIRQHKVEVEFDVLGEKLFDRLTEMQRETFKMQIEAMDKFATKLDLAAVEKRITHHIDALREPRRRGQT